MEHVTEISGLLLLYPEKIADKLNELQSLGPISGSRACINYVACVSPEAAERVRCCCRSAAACAGALMEMIVQRRFC